MKPMMFKGRVAAGALGLIAVALVFSAAGPGTSAAIVTRVKTRVPQAEAVLGFRGAGFTSTKNRTFMASSASPKGAQEAQTVNVTAPTRANGSFEIKDGRGQAHGTLRLVGASKQDAHVEDGTLVYPSAYPNVDVLMARDPAHLELSYVAQTTTLPPLAINVGGDDNSQLTIETSTGAALLRAHDGKPQLRVERPIAFDSAGNQREGSYVVADAHTLRIEMNVAGMTPPVLIDPAFFIPFWTLDEDGRGPGNVAYDSQRQSREAQIVLNTAIGRPWLIRPAKSLQPWHYDEALGASRPEEQYSPVSTTPRVSGRHGPPPNPLLQQDFQRTVASESETYEWQDDGWHLLPTTNLPGFIDPTFAFDSGRQRAVAIGGRVQSADESTTLLYASTVFENDGNGWAAKGVPGGPTPRVRAASVGFGSKIVVFGGRSLTAKSDLLNDTWIYDGKTWQKVPVSNPPPACESSQLIHDTRRDRVVLVGGNCALDAVPFNPSDADGFRLWEFDGSDWTRRFDVDDASLPQSFRPRHGVAAAWNPVRRTTMLFGGLIDVTELCTVSPSDLVLQRHQADIDIFLNNDFTKKTQLEKQGCWGGYVHDTWEWDGTTLRALTRVAYGTSSTDRRSHAIPIFQQVLGQVPSPSAAVDSRAPASTTKLWPWRYDSRPEHFAQRSVLERSAAQPGVPNAAPVTAGGQIIGGTAGAPSVIVSPVFAPVARPQLIVKPDGKLLVFSSDDGQVFESDLTSWTVRTPSASPFAEGQNDFFAATWDSARQKTVLFDPPTGATWEHDASGWRRIQTVVSPGVWAEPTWWRLMRDPFIDAYPSSFNARLPRMTYDRARSRTLMLYRNALWAYDGASWTQASAPQDLQACTAATLMTFDGVRNRTVVVGCKVPARTWEWDGSSWLGPFASPFQDKVLRDIPQPASALSFEASLQLEFMHPNALFESPSLGGVGIIDGAGTLRVWKGSEWLPGAAFGDPVMTDAFINYNRNRTGVSYATPAGFFPPVVEDFSANRLLAFRDGIRGTRELALATPQAAQGWQDTFVGEVASDDIHPNGVATVHPFPLELLPSDWVASQAANDPTSVISLDGNPMARPFQRVPLRVFLES